MAGAKRAMSDEIAIFGFGPVGRATAEILRAQGRPVRIAQRKEPENPPAGAAFVRCDALDGESVRAAARGAAQVVLAVGFPYQGAVWREAWPRAMTNFVEACAATGARLVFADNLYMYGPQTAPLSETTPLTPYGVKPAARVEVTRIWMAASEAGRLRVAALRAPDFYGPGAAQSHLGETAFGALAKGKTANVIGSPDTPHDFAYVPDFARRRHLARRLRRLFRPGMAHSLRADADPARNSRARRGGARRQAARLRPADLGARAARFVRPGPQRNARNAVSVGPALSRRLEPLRQAVLGRRDAVRGRRARDRAVVPQSRARVVNGAAVSALARGVGAL
jgi:hypothetical protein